MLAAGAVPASALATNNGVVTPQAVCVSPTTDATTKQIVGYWATFSYTASGLSSQGKNIPAGKSNQVSIGGVPVAYTQNGQQPWIEHFVNTSQYKHAFQIWFPAAMSVKWTVTVDKWWPWEDDVARSAVADKNTERCGERGQPGTPGAPGLAPLIETIAPSDQYPTGGLRITERDYDAQGQIVLGASYVIRNGTSGTNGTDGKSGLAPLIETVAPSDQYPTGGLRITERDYDAQGQIVLGASYVIRNGTNGKDGLAPLIETIEPSDEYPTGALRITERYYDVLGEIVLGSRYVVRNGTDGVDGKDGLAPLIETIEPSDDYPTGGLRIIERYYDDAGEIVVGKQYVIRNGVDGKDGRDGLSGLTPSITALPVGDERCAAGGMVIASYAYAEVGSAQRDEGVVQTDYYVCNGRDGNDGNDGRDGVDGKDGKDGKEGAPGTTTVVYVTTPADSVSRGGVAGATASNKVSRRVAKLRIVARKGRTVGNLRVRLEGRLVRVKRTAERTWIATIDLRGLRRGTYAAQVTARVNGRNVTRKHLYRVLYGNPKGAGKTGLNAGPIVRL